MRSRPAAILIRNTTSDPYAGVAAEELADPRVYCEIIRQWSTLHPEFTFLPRKFKIAVTASPNDRAAVKVHDIGIAIRKNAAGETGFEVLVGGGLGRTPMVGQTIRDFLPKEHLLSYLEAILRVYNLNGRRDNKYKARIKILVHDLGTDALPRTGATPNGKTCGAKARNCRRRNWSASGPSSRRRHMKSPAAIIRTISRSCAPMRGFAEWVRANVGSTHKETATRSSISR